MVYGDVRTMRLYKKKFVTARPSHKTPTNDHFRRNSDCMWLMTLLLGFQSMYQHGCFEMDIRLLMDPLHERSEVR